MFVCDYCSEEQPDSAKVHKKFNFGKHGLFSCDLCVDCADKVTRLSWGAFVTGALNEDPKYWDWRAKHGC